MMNNQKVNILYDALGKVELVEMVLKSEGMSLEEIQKVKAAISDKIKESTC